MQEKILAILEAIAVGDAVGMPTEFMTRKDIVKKFGFVDCLLNPEQSQNHSNLTYASITDDTEQNFYLLQTYLNNKQEGITPENTANCLLRWIKETGAEEKKYIGPSSLKALKLIEEGVNPREAGKSGTTCGAIMRTPAAVLYSYKKDYDALAKDIVNCAMPTHFTSTALEAACGYGFALKAAIEQKSMSEILELCNRGAEYGLNAAPYKECAASGTKRIAFLKNAIDNMIFKTKDEFLDFIFDIFGTGLPSQDVFAAVMGIFMYAGKDVWLSICLGASIGGDTDTIACLAGALSAAFAGGHNIQAKVLEDVIKNNPINADDLAKKLL